MTRYLNHLAACYRVTLRLYPSQLRTGYGDEMAADFQRLIHDAYRRRGGRAVARISVRAFGEFFTVALPGHLVSDWFIAASLSFVITSSVLGLLVGIMTARVPMIHAVMIHSCR
jgi:hypothetical protein